MIHQMNSKLVTSNELVRTVVCSVLEDVDKHFEDYAKTFITNYDEYNEEDLLAIDRWRAKVFNKLNSFLNKKGLFDE